MPGILEGLFSVIVASVTLGPLIRTHHPHSAVESFGATLLAVGILHDFLHPLLLFFRGKGEPFRVLFDRFINGGLSLFGLIGGQARQTRLEAGCESFRGKLGAFGRASSPEVGRSRSICRS